MYNWIVPTVHVSNKNQTRLQNQFAINYNSSPDSVCSDARGEDPVGQLARHEIAESFVGARKEMLVVQ